MFVAAHAGAGFHSPHRAEECRKACKQACKEAVRSFRQTDSVLEAAVAAVVALEEDPSTNAGFGSNLTLTGTVECDASVMLGNGAYGAVGSVEGVRNPILLAKALLQEEMKGRLSLGRVPPIFMVGEGARQWGIEYGVPMCIPDQLISGVLPKCGDKNNTFGSLEESFRVYNTYKERLIKGSAKLQIPNSSRLDTVGSVCVDQLGQICAATSSGGIILKRPGRVGQACVFGCGCWADAKSDLSVACSTTGVGEQLIKTMLAMRCCEALQQRDRDDTIETVRKCFRQNYQESSFLSSVPADEKQAGLISLQYYDGMAELLWAHSAHSMCIGYMSSKDPKPKTLLSSMPKGLKAENPLTLGGCCHHL
eukprot:m.75280 g.75280  ORF g.75280 m.75280 type:complete len:365 (+) comp35936_c0_seq6:118-1212(+)